MTENKVCKGCRWNKYPECLGTKMYDGEFMRIDNLKEHFVCGRKDRDDVADFSIVKKSVLELKIEELTARIKKLEK